jgi:hypothetical protein
MVPPIGIEPIYLCLKGKSIANMLKRHYLFLILMIVNNNKKTDPAPIAGANGAPLVNRMPMIIAVTI